MIHPISRIADARFCEFQDLLTFVRSKDCPQGVMELDSTDPIISTWHVDAVMESFFAHGGKRLTDEEIARRFGSQSANIDSMKTIVYLEDGSIEATVRADEFVAAGRARYATPEEIATYEQGFARDDARIAALED